METLPRRHRLTVDEYYRMAEVGLLAPDARVELIEGEIIDMPPIGPEHGSVVDRLTYRLIKAVGDAAIVRVQGAVRLDPWSEPQPDIAVLARRTDFYRSAHPTGSNVHLIIEVSDSTLRYDLDIKVPLYARHGVPEVWVLDLRHGELIVHSDRSENAYRQRTSTAHPELTPIPGLTDVVVDLSGLP